MFKGLQETVRENKSLRYPVFQLPGVNCSLSSHIDNHKNIFLIKQKRSTYDINDSAGTAKN